MLDGRVLKLYEDITRMPDHKWANKIIEKLKSAGEIVTWIPKKEKNILFYS